MLSEDENYCSSEDEENFTEISGWVVVIPKATSKSLFPTKQRDEDDFEKVDVSPDFSGVRERGGCTRMQAQTHPKSILNMKIRSTREVCASPRIPLSPIQAKLQNSSLDVATLPCEFKRAATDLVLTARNVLQRKRFLRSDAKRRPRGSLAKRYHGKD